MTLSIAFGAYHVLPTFPPHLLESKISMAIKQLGAEVTSKTGLRAPSIIGKKVPGAAAGHDIMVRLFPGQIGLPLLAYGDKSDTLVITFAGNVPVPLTPSEIMDRSDLHVLALHDTARCFCVAGLPGLGDTYEETLASVKKIAAELKVTKIFCVGSSAGGFAAMRYGLDLGASGVLAFSCPTTLNLDDEPGASVSKYPQLAALYKKDRSQGISLVPLYKNAEFRPETVIFFSPTAARDKIAAERMADLPGVTLIQAPDAAEHLTYLFLKENDLLSGYFEQLFTFKPVPLPQTATLVAA